MIVIWCLIYFVAGAFRDALSTLYYRAVTRLKFRAMLWTGTIEIFDFVVFATLLVGWHASRVPCIICYVIGAMIGTGLVIKHGKGKENRRNG